MNLATKHSVLITSVGGNVGQGVIKSLRAGKRDYHIVGIDMEPMSAWFSLCDRYITVPRTAAPEFEAALVAIIEREKIEAIYVCSPPELDYFCSRKDHLETDHDLSIFVNPRQVIEIGSDKLKTAQFLQQRGLPYPRSAMAADRAEVQAIIDQFGFPVILKPRDGAASKNVFVVRSYEEIDALAHVTTNLVAQRYLPDDEQEYTSAVLCGPDGKSRAAITLRRQLLQGTTYRTELMWHEAVDTFIKSFAEVLGVIGVCNFQFRLVDGEPVIFEINPRFSGTSGIRYVYGFNEAEMMFEMFRLGIEIEQPELNDAVTLRYWNEIILQGATFDSLRSGDSTHDGKQHYII